jgi:hypothetical protein
MDMAKSIDRADLASPFVVRCQLFKNDFLSTDNGRRTTGGDDYRRERSFFIFNAS